MQEGDCDRYTKKKEGKKERAGKRKKDKGLII